jgi:hypothetical protein
MLLLLVTSRLLADASCHNCRPTVKLDTTYRDCVFSGCRSSSNGGALYISNAAVALCLILCRFFSCYSGGEGGSVYSRPCKSSDVNQTTVHNCSCNSYTASLYIAIRVDSTATLVADGVSASLCLGSYNTIALSCHGPEPAGSTATIRVVNSTANVASTYASGFYTNNAYNLSLHYCTLAGNSPHTCLGFDLSITNNNIGCIGLYNNTCGGSGGAGLVHTKCAVTLSDCAFFGNHFQGDWLAGSDANTGPFTLTLVRCLWDFETANQTRRITLKTEGCARRPNAQLAGTDCPWNWNWTASAAFTDAWEEGMAPMRILQVGVFVITVDW